LCNSTRDPGNTDSVVIDDQQTVTIASGGTAEARRLYVKNARLVGSGPALSTLNIAEGGTWSSSVSDENRFTSLTVNFAETGGSYMDGNSDLRFSNTVVNIGPGTSLEVGRVVVDGSAAAINNEGFFNMFGGPLTMANGSKFSNLFGSVFFAAGDLTIDGLFDNQGDFYAAGRNLTFADASKFSQTNSSATLYTGPSVTGTTGTLTLQDGFVVPGPDESLTTFTVASLVNTGATLISAVDNDGSVRPVGLSVVGAYVQGANGKLWLTYCNSEGFSRLQVDGAATIDGTVAVFLGSDLGCNSASGSGRTFTGLLATGAVTGTFSTLTPPSANRTLTANYQPSSVVLTYSSVLTATASVSPTSLAFSTNQPVGVSSANQTVTVTNTGPVNINFAAILPDIATQPFRFGMGTCSGVSLPNGQSCNVTVRYDPTAPGAASYDLITFLSAATSNSIVYTPSTVPITGTAAVVLPSLATSNYAFGSVPLGGSLATTVTLIANSGATGLSFSSNLTQFTIASNNCPANVTAGNNCTFDIVFQPAAVASYNGTMTVGSNEGAIGTVAVSGSGTAPSVSFTPASITHPTTTISASDVIANQVFTNTSTAAITLAATNALTGSNPQFVISSGSTGTPCINGLVMAAGSSCTYSSTFTPTIVASIGASYTIAYTAASVSFSSTVGVGGSSASPTTSFTPSSFSHPATVVGQPNVIANQTFTNTSPVAITLAASNALTGSNPQFVISAGSTGTPCTNGLVLNAGASCTYTSTFTPTSVASFGASYTFNYSVLGVNFSATIGMGGSSVAPTTSFTPSSVAHGSVPVGLPSLLSNNTFTNTSPVAITLAPTSALSSASGLFVIAPGSTGTPCTNSLTLASGASCTFNSTYTPSGVASNNSSYTVNYSVGAATFTNNVSVSGAGIAGSTLAPATISFGNVPVSVGASQTATLSNPSGVPVRIVSITNSDIRFASTPSGAQPCAVGNDVLAGSSCTLSLTFTPAGTGSYNNTTTITYQPNATGPTYTVTQNSNGTGFTLPSTISPSSISFGNTTIGTTLNQVVVFANTSNTTSFPSTYTITGLATSGLGFSASGSGATPCSVNATLAPGASCTFTETFLVNSGSTGSYNGTTTLSFLTGQGANPTYTQAVNANATIVTSVPGLTLSTTSLTFATPQLVGSSSGTQAVTLNNTGNTTINLTLPFIASGDFSVTNNCPASLAPAGTCTAFVTFSPTSPGARTGQMSITSTAPSSPDTVLLSGTGNAAPTITSGAPPVGVVGAPYTFTFTASGNPASTWSLLSGTLPPGLTLNSVSGVLSGTPTAPGTFSATVQATNSVGTAPAPVSITINLPQANVEIFNTGVNASGGLLALGSVDPHYQLTVSADANMPGPAAYVANPIPTGYWMANGPGSQWIAPAVDQSYPNPPATCNAAGNYTYRTTFDLTGFSLPTVVLNGNWAADNSGISILLNGNATGAPGASGYGAFSAFTLNTGFINGVNTLDFVINDSGCPSGLRVEISGTGNATTASYSPSLGLSFGNVVQSTTSNPLQAVFTNTSPVSLTLSSISFLGGGAGFSILGTSQCLSTPTLAPGASCTFDVTATPAAAGTLKDAIRVVTSPANAGAPSVLALSVTGVPPALAGLGVSTGALNFGPVSLTQTSNPQTLTLTNSGNTTLNFTSAFAVSGDFAFTTTCGSSLAPAASCTVDVTFSPVATGTRNGTLTLASNAPTSPDVVVLSGIGAAVPTITYVGGTSVAPGGTLNLVFKLTNAGQLGVFGAAISVTYPTGFTNQPPGPFPQAGCSSTLGAYVAGGNSSSVTGGTIFGVTPPSSANCNLLWTKLTAPSTPGTYTFTLPPGSVSFSLPFAYSNPTAITFDVTVTTLLAPTLSFSAAPSSITAGSPAVGTLTVTNPNAVPLTANPFTFNYAPGIVNAPSPNASSTCPGVTPSATPGASSSATTTGFTIPANGSCTFSVSITSATPAVYSGNITAGLIVTNGGSTNATPFSLTVTAAPPPSLGLSSSVVTFASQNVGSTSGAQTITITNTGSANLTWSGFTLGGANAGDFARAGTCSPSSPVVPTAQCTITITFTPVGAGARSANLTLASNAPGSPHVITLFGTGTSTGAPPAITSNSSLPSGMTGQQYGHTFVASGTGPITWSVFSGALPPGLSLSPGGSLTGVPNQPGTYFFTVRASNSAGAANQGVAILVAAPLVAFITATPSSLTFGNQATLTTSPSQTVTITSTGNGPAQIQNIVGSGDFRFNSGCPLAPATLAPAATCTISVSFAPLVAGPLTGSISVTTTTGNSATVSLAGNGVNVPRPSIAIAPSRLVFGDQAVGSTSAQQSFTISNSGQADLQLRGLELSGGGFSTNNDGISNSCGSVVRPGGSCRIGIVFAPTVTGPANAAFNITHNATPTGDDTTVNVGLSGNGTPRREPVIRVSGNLFFNEQVIGTTSPIQTVSVSNVGTANLAITGISISTAANTDSGDFSVGGNCGNLAPGASCSLTVAFTPSAPIGPKGAVLNIGSNASNANPPGAGTVSVGLSGTAAAVPQPVVKLSSTTIGFGNMIYGSFPTSQQVTLTNAGNRVLNIGGIVIFGDYIQTNTCGGTLNPNQSCSINILFSPLGLGPRNGTLSITSNAPSSPDVVTLSGAGCRYFSPAASRFFVTSC
jgi:hypothetical protein